MKSEHTDTRQHILDCGQRLIAAKGFVGVGLSEILSSAEVPKGSFYHYFGSKEQYGNTLLESYFTEYLGRLDALFGQTGKSGAERLGLYLSRWTETQSGEDAKQTDGWAKKSTRSRPLGSYSSFLVNLLISRRSRLPGRPGGATPATRKRRRASLASARAARLSTVSS